MLINNYSDSPWHKSLLKEIFFCARFLWLLVINGGRVRTILFYPDFPLFKTEINRVLRGSRYNITNNPACRHDAVFAWEDATFRRSVPLLPLLQQQQRVFNLNCNDISKREVERASRKIFGYGLEIDPHVYQGRCVRKSNYNGRHDETRLLRCPLEGALRASPDIVYQRLVNTHTGADEAEDLRAYICGDGIVFAVRRLRPLSARFSGDMRAQVHTAEELFSPGECARILRLARFMGLDYGEIDTVRDIDDGRLYVVDVNNTPYSPPAGALASTRERKHCTRLQRAAVIRNLVQATSASDLTVSAPSRNQV